VKKKQIDIKVFPGSSRCEIVEKDGLVKVYVKASPDKGKANKAVIALIAKKYKAKKTDVNIIKGSTNCKKIVQVVFE